MQVTDLGLELRGVPQAHVDAAQLMLAYRTPREVREYLRPHCGPAQDQAETLAAECLLAHTPDLATPGLKERGLPTWCDTCAEAWPCAVARGDLRVFGGVL